MADTPETIQATAEPLGTTDDRASASAPAAPAERPQLASLADALNRAAERKPAPADQDATTPTRPKESDATGAPATAVKPDASKPSPGASPTAQEPPEAGHSADEASNPDKEASEPTGKDGKGTAPDPQSPRRERAEIRDLTAERDALKARTAQLESALTIPEHVQQAAIATRLPDPEFNALSVKRQREGLTGEYLTHDENQKLDTAIQVRDWSHAWYADAQQQAVSWVQGQVADVQDKQAKDLAPVLKERPHLSPELIGRADTWRAIYDHLCEASETHGREAERAELQPKLDAANGRIHDLEAELAGRRSRGGQGRTFERGGTSGGAYVARPDFKSASARDLFAAAQEEGAQRRTRRAG